MIQASDFELHAVTPLHVCTSGHCPFAENLSNFGADVDHGSGGYRDCDLILFIAGGDDRVTLDAFARLADPREIRKMREDLPIYIFSGSEDPVGLRLEGVRVLIDRYRSAGITSISHDFYPGGRHEMLHEINRRDVITNLLVWISGILEKRS